MFYRCCGPVYFSLSSYAIVEMPHGCGTMAYSGGTKHFFPKCIINPIKAKSVKEDIIYYVENAVIPQYQMRVIHEFFGSLERLSDFDIVSYNKYSDYTFEGRSTESFLLQKKGSGDKRRPTVGGGCVVFRDKETKQILGFAN
jgi:hypothetical protein